MTLYQKSGIVTAAVISACLILMAFNYGRLTASRIEMYDNCARMDFTIPFKGTVE